LRRAFCRERRLLEIGRIETNLLRDGIDEHVDAGLHGFRKAAFTQWTTHPVSHLAEDAVGQLSLDRTRVLCERTLRGGGDNQQQALAARRLRANIPFAREALRILCYSDAVSGIDQCHV